MKKLCRKSCLIFSQYLFITVQTINKVLQSLAAFCLTNCLLLIIRQRVQHLQQLLLRDRQHLEALS